MPCRRALATRPQVSPPRRYSLSLLREPRGLSVDAIERRELGPDAEPPTWMEWFFSWFGAPWPQAVEPEAPSTVPAAAAPEGVAPDAPVVSDSNPAPAAQSGTVTLERH